MEPLTLPEKPTIADFQAYVALMVKRRGFDKETVPELFMLLMEECGELAKAARKYTAIRSHADTEKFRLEHELADVFVYLLALANRFNVDLEHAFREKEEINKTRTWE